LRPGFRNSNLTLNDVYTNPYKFDKFSSGVTHSSIIAILAVAAFPFGTFATTPNIAEIYSERISNAVTLLDDTVDLLTEGPIENPEFLDTITANVEAIQRNITDSKDDVAYVFSEHGLFSYLTSVAFPQITPYVSKALSYPTLTDPTTLILVNQPFISQDTIDRLGTFTSMVLVGNYTPTGLDYASLTSLQHLRMYYGNIGDVRSSIQSLVRTTRALRYLEIPTWGTDTIENDAFRATSAVKNTTLQQLVGFEDVTTICDYAFEYCTGLTSVSFLNVTSVGNSTFANCSINSLSLPKLESAGNCPFQTCNANSLYLPKLKTVGNAAFHNSSITSISVPNLETAGTEPFAWAKCTSVYAPKLKQAGGGAFYNNGSIRDVTFPDTAGWGGNSFNGTAIATVRVIGEYQREGGYASYSASDGNGITKISFAFGSSGFGSPVTSFYFSLGEKAQALSNTSTNKSLFNFISGVLSVTRAQFPQLKSGTTTHGYLDLGSKFSGTGLSFKGSDYLIDTIINAGSTPIVQ
jgi:hypothetical protein